MRYFLYFFLFIVLIIPSCIENEGVLSSIDAGMQQDSIHRAPDTSSIPTGPLGDMIRYGKELMDNTPYYIGPEGISGKYAQNKMTCTNCHLEAGTRPYAFNFFSTYGSYPQYRSRENEVLTIEQRVNNCITRPLNGTPIPLDSKEMIAFVSYIKWLGTNVPIGEEVTGFEGGYLVFPDRAADPEKGKKIFMEECALCHGADGKGKMLADNSKYEFPPLWGPEAYQSGSSMFRIIKAARFIKYNMPNGITWENPKLTDAEALDVAAFINSPDNYRPGNKPSDYSDLRTKYVDFPFGPYDDPFSEEQHKYGPFKPIIEYRKKKQLYLSY